MLTRGPRGPNDDARLCRGGGEMPAPRGFDELHQRREVVSSRAAWCPDSAGPYRLPAGVRDRLSAALAGRKNRDAAFSLAVFLARFWSSPRRLLCAIPVDRRALAEHEALGLTEARVRGALAVLVEVGFLARYEPEAGKKYQRTRAAFSVARSCTGSPRSMPSRSRQRMPALRQPVERQRHPAGQYPRVPSPNGRQRPTSPLPGPCPHPKSPKSNP